MAVDMFIKIDDIKGESIDDSHADEIDLLAWSWGMSQSGTTHSGAGGGAGKVNVQDLSFTHYTDKASPNLMKMCCNGTHFKEATLVVRKAGKTPLEYMKIIMEDGLISSVSTGGSGGEDRLTENVALNFSKFKTEYVPQKGDGSGDASVIIGWDIAKNVDAS
ncbi:MAG: type VI secretion system tube protein Hcp [Gammaproteobacteria bacterium]|nr:type VI secretion system tube protein Hcp [Gammaproteobacteria bacterium]